MFSYRIVYVIAIFSLLLSQEVPSDIKRKLIQSGVNVDDAKKFLNKNRSSSLTIPNPQNSTSDINEAIIDEMNEDIVNIKNNDLSIDIASSVDSNDDNENSKSSETIIENKEQELLAKNSNIDSIAFFGYNTFSKDPEFFQKTNDLSVGPYYEIGPGDEIIVMLWGETELVRKLTVSREGYIFIPDIGQVFVNGLNLEKLEKKLFNLLSKVYSSLLSSNNKNSSTYFDVSIGSLSLQPTRIFVLGEVSQPGAYDVKSSTSLFTSLFYFKGPKTSGSLRSIKLIRNSKDENIIDFYDYLLEGKKTKDIRLQDDDVVFIPERGKTVTVSGEITRKAIYELKNKEGLKDLIRIAGGLKNTTYTERVQIDRIVPFNDRKRLGMDRTIIDVTLSDILSGNQDIELVDGDFITFFDITKDRKNAVNISGPVVREGRYAIGESGLTFSELIKKADGLTGDAYMNRAEITRQNEHNTRDQIIINLEKAILKDKNHDINLMSNDFIKLFTKSEMFFYDSVKITGNVKNPGSFEFKNGMTIYDLIFIGGGFKDISFLQNTYTERSLLRRLDTKTGKLIDIFFNLDSVLSKKGSYNMPLQMGDEIKIFSKQEIQGSIEGFYTISGYVKKPGLYQLGKDTKLSNALFLSGGMEDSLFLSDMVMERVDILRRIDSLNKNKMSYSVLDVIDSSKNIDPILKNGDEVIVYSKKLYRKEKFVTIDGSVQLPGVYDLKKNMTLMDLILEAGGPITQLSDYRIEVISIDKNSLGKRKKEELNVYNFNSSISRDDISANIDSKSNSKLSLKLSSYDHITVRPYNIENLEFVNIVGKVKYPGRYVLTSKKNSINKIINRAGGVTEDAYPEASRLIRDGISIRISFKKLLKSSNDKMNFSLVDGDSIIIGSKTNIVTVNGAVNSPGAFPYNKNKKLNYYIDIAGGYTTEAAKYSSYITYPDGTSKNLKILNSSPRVMDGSVITVIEKKDVEPFSVTEYVTNLTAIYADVIQAIALLKIINN